MTLLSRDAILTVDDRKYEEVDVPEWGGKVRIRSLTGREFDDFQTSILIEKKDGTRKTRTENLRVRLIVRCIVDEEGQQVFGEDDIRQLGKKSIRPIERIFTACQKLLGMTDDDVEEMTKDFEKTQDDS